MCRSIPGREPRELGCQRLDPRLRAPDLGARALRRSLGIVGQHDGRRARLERVLGTGGSGQREPYRHVDRRALPRPRAWPPRRPPAPRRRAPRPTPASSAKAARPSRSASRPASERPLREGGTTIESRSEARREAPRTRGGPLLLGGQAGKLASARSRRLRVAAAACDSSARTVPACSRSLARVARRRRAEADSEAAGAAAAHRPRVDDLGALGGGRLQRERAQAPLDLTLDVARALEIDSAHAPEPRAGHGGGGAGTCRGPAASSISARRSSGRASSTSSTLPCEITQCRSRPMPASASASCTSRRRTAVRPEQVLGRAVAMQAPHHGYLRLRQADASVGVVEHQLDLADTCAGRPSCRRTARPCPPVRGSRSASTRHRPLQGVRDVRLAGAVGSRRSRRRGEEAELDLLGERLEAADAERAQVHGLPFSSSRRAPRALQPVRTSLGRAAAGGRATTPSTSATDVKRRRCGGPSESISS